MSALFELKRTADDQFMFNLKAANGEVILTSERYTGKSAATNGIDSVRRNAPDDERYDRLSAKNGSPYFTLKATNGQIIGVSEMYSSEQAMEKGIASVKANGPQARLDDRS
jgi:uncharacterized protein YegP (UPF0339 family)